jgi:sugar lactone lactonase YvrE
MNFSSNTKHSFVGDFLRGAVIAFALLAGLAQMAMTALAAEPDFGEASVLAQVPQPGFPEGIVRSGFYTYVTGPATFGTAGNGIPSKIWVYNTVTGNLVHTENVVGEDLSQEHANSCAAVDGWGRLYVLNTQLGVIRYHTLPNGNLIGQQVYGKPLPNLPPCVAVPAGTPCSPLPVDTPPLSNDLAFDLFGNLYVTDSLQATIWRYSAGGGAPQIWFQDIRLAPNAAPGSIGVNGIRIHPLHNKVFFAVTIDFNGQSRIYTLPLIHKPKATDLQVFHTFAPDDLPDGIAFGLSGVLYVTDATPFSSGIIGLRSNGAEVFRFTNPANTPINPYDSPANIAFDGRGSLLVTNHAFATGGMNPQQFQVLKVYVRDLEIGLFKPLILN